MSFVGGIGTKDLYLAPEEDYTGSTSEGCTLVEVGIDTGTDTETHNEVGKLSNTGPEGDTEVGTDADKNDTKLRILVVSNGNSMDEWRMFVSEVVLGFLVWECRKCS